MTTAPDPIAVLAAEDAARRPWTVADENSIWVITGTYPGGRGTFTTCVATVVPFFVTGGTVLFKMIGALDEYVDPQWITRARELLLVDAQDPRQAYLERDQDHLDRALQVSS